MEKGVVEGTSVYWKRKHSLILYGGSNVNVKTRSGVFSLNIESGKWNQLTTGEEPKGRWAHTATLFKDDLMIVFGGLDDTLSYMKYPFILNLKNLSIEKLP